MFTQLKPETMHLVPVSIINFLRRTASRFSHAYRDSVYAKRTHFEIVGGMLVANLSPDDESRK